MSKFKKGEKVKVKSGLTNNVKYGDIRYINEMGRLEEYTVSDYLDCFPEVFGVEENVYLYHESMVEPVEDAGGLSRYGQNIVKMMERQHQKGLKKYGETLEDNTTLSREQRIEHLQEELIDALQYCEHIKAANDSLTVADYQRMAMRTANPECHNPANFALGLAGEAGECADIVKKHLFQGHELDKEHLAEELGDVAWYIALAADTIGISMEEILNRNIKKLKKRYPEGFDKARSINREEYKHD